MHTKFHQNLPISLQDISVKDSQPDWQRDRATDIASLQSSFASFARVYACTI